MNDQNDHRGEKRYLDKVAVFLEISCSPDPELTEICVTHTLDLSESGLKILSDCCLPVGSMHQLRVEYEAQRFNLVGEVAWSGTESGECVLGFSLLDSPYTDTARWKSFVLHEFKGRI